MPPITKEQIEWGELASLLLEEDYNLSTMVDYLVVLINTCFHFLKLTLDCLNISKSDDCLNLSSCQYKNNDWSNFFHGFLHTSCFIWHNKIAQVQNVVSSLLEYVQFLHISAYYFLNSIATISFDISIPLFLSFQLGSSQGAHAHIIQEGLLYPSPDVSEMLSEATTTDQGTYSYIMPFRQFAIRVPDLILFNTLSPFLGYCIYFLYIDIQPSESLSQVAALNIGRLLSKAPEIK